MELDDEVCLCFHVTRRKIRNYLRIEKPARVGELSHCFGAGTGCGWCRKYLQALFDASRGKCEELNDYDTLSREDYASSRGSYIAAGKKRPPAEEA